MIMVRFQLRKARALNVAGRGLQQIPDDVFQMALEENVPNIDVSNNALREMPDG